MWLDVEVIRDFMAALVTCKIDKDWIKSLDNIVSIISLWENFSSLKGK